MNTEPLCVLYHHTPVGWLQLCADAQGLCGVHFVPQPGPDRGDCPVLTLAAAQLDEYFAGQRRQFTLPLSLNGQGTPFQRRVWAALCRIPYGTTCSYGELAAAVGCPGGHALSGWPTTTIPWRSSCPATGW